MEINKINDSDLQVNVHHIGGIGECGPVEQMKMINNDVVWVFYDADKDSLNSTDLGDKKYILINACIGAKEEERTFNIMKNASASSLYESSPKAKDYVLPQHDIETWGDHTEIVRKEKMNMVTLNTILKDPRVPSIDVLSIDAQAEDLNIIKSVDLDNIGAVICEVEFSELYKGQPLVFDVHKYMHDNHFRFCQLYNNQDMNVKPYPSYVRGKGFLTVGEVLFFKEPEWLLDEERLKTLSKEELTKTIIAAIKLAATGVCFNQVNFAIHTLKMIEERGFMIDEITKDNKRYMPSLRNLKQVCDAVIDMGDKR